MLFIDFLKLYLFNFSKFSIKSSKESDLSETSANKGVDKYRSAVSGKTTKILDPFLAFLATSNAAANVAPLEIPQKIPSFRA